MASNRLGAFGYPFVGENGERPLVAVWVLYMLAFLVPVVPLVPVVGYLARVVHASVQGETAPSVRSAPVSLLRRGIGGFVVAFGYMAVPILVLAVTVYGASVSGPPAGTDLFDSVVVYGGSTAVLCLVLTGAYLAPIGLATYVERESLRSAFTPASLRDVALHAAYFARWTAGLVAVTLTLSLANVFSNAPRVGPVLAALVLAYGSILAFHVWGRAIRSARKR